MNLTELWPIILQTYKGRGRLFLVSYAFQTLEKCVFFEGLQLILVPFFKISYGFRDTKILLESAIHVI